MGSGGLRYKSFSSIDYDHDDNEYYDVPSKAVQEKLDSLLNDTAAFSEEKRALHYARLFRVNQTAFDNSSDRECEIRNGYIKKKGMISDFRSFIWCLASYLSDQEKRFDEVSIEDIHQVIKTIDEGINYNEDSYFQELCSLPENFSVYTDLQIPQARIISAFLSLEESESNTVNCLGNLSNLRNELRLLIPAMDLIYADLKSKRDYRQPLEGTASDILNCWCVIALAAESNVVSATTGRLGMYWDQFEDQDDFQDWRSPSEIISGIKVPWLSHVEESKAVSKEEAEAVSKLLGSIGNLQSSLQKASSSASDALKITKNFDVLRGEADKREAEKEQHIRTVASEACQYGRDIA